MDGELQSSNTHKLTCISDFKPPLCSLEFSRNGKTVDDIRSENGTCYHKGGLCDTALCSCNCTHYTLHLQVDDNTKSCIYSCELLYGRSKTKVSILYNKTGI